ncbi:hypothetical protein KIF24_10520 [Micromonospora sp. Llam7]|uniref:hypothetical protein n=1 Tax=Micromonospora tarapacensis TaxID=2835305 RepID=UPI001C83B52F|nr:hypothetical protein [Micromonospora tarapacensis]MBX7266417.1 hypothetical protein [Micromonospora tarapacensis]
MATRLGSIDATPVPERCLITIIGADFDTFDHPDPTPHPLCWASTEQIHLFSEISSGHRAHVRVEAWDGPAPPETDEWEAHGRTELRSTSGTLSISVLDERLLTPPLPIGEPGPYTVDVHVTGRRRLRALRGQDAWYADEPPTAVERFRVRVWPQA